MSRREQFKAFVLIMRGLFILIGMSYGDMREEIGKLESWTKIFLFDAKEDDLVDKALIGE